MYAMYLAIKKSNLLSHVKGGVFRMMISYNLVKKQFHLEL